MTIQPRDLVVCVDGAPCRCCRLPFPIASGKVLRVDDVAIERFIGGMRLGLAFSAYLEDASHTKWFDALRFRKLNDGKKDQELIAKIKACKPARGKVSA